MRRRMGSMVRMGANPSDDYREEVLINYDYNE